MRTIAFPGYDQDAFNRGIHSLGITQRGRQTHTQARLSAFQVPNSVVVEIGESEHCVVRFVYPNDELSEGQWRRIDSHLSIKVGRYSRKVLEARINDAARVLADGTYSFDPSASSKWVEGLDPRRQHTAVENAVVVSAILEHMPDSVRRWILRQLPSSHTEEWELDRDC